MNGWREISGNEDVFKALHSLLAAKQAVAFVGAGASAGLYPTWGPLIKRLAEAAAAEGADADELGLITADIGRDPQQAVSEIRRHLTEGIYLETLSELFSARTDGDAGDAFTQVHGYLLRLPFRGYATTNYDPGLYEARRKLHPELPVTGFATPLNETVLHRWLTGEMSECPILSVHGSFDDPTSIVLDADDYRRAYAEGTLYRQVFFRLWCQERLVFVGFGFSDPWLKFLVDQNITVALARKVSKPRHVALIGVPEGELRRSAFVPLHRRRFAELYHTRTLFYPVREIDGIPDHSVLLEILSELHEVLVDLREEKVERRQSPTESDVKAAEAEKLFYEITLGSKSGAPTVRLERHQARVQELAAKSLARDRQAYEQLEEGARALRGLINEVYSSGAKGGRLRCELLALLKEVRDYFEGDGGGPLAELIYAWTRGPESGRAPIDLLKEHQASVQALAAKAQTGDEKAYHRMMTEAQELQGLIDRVYDHPESKAREKCHKELIDIVMRARQACPRLDARFKVSGIDLPIKGSRAEPEPAKPESAAAQQAGQTPATGGDFTAASAPAEVPVAKTVSPVRIEWAESGGRPEPLMINIKNTWPETLRVAVVASVALWAEEHKRYVVEHWEGQVWQGPLKYYRLSTIQRDLALRKDGGFQVLGVGGRGKQLAAEGTWKVTFKIRIGDDHEYDEYEEHLCFEFLGPSQYLRALADCPRAGS